MIERVIDASVLMKWFKPAGERHLEAARQLRQSYERGAMLLMAPPLLPVEILNAAGRRWHWTESELAYLAQRLERIRLEIRQPPLTRIAHWTSQGLTAYDASYVALAEARRSAVITDDARIISIASPLAVPLETWKETASA